MEKSLLIGLLLICCSFAAQAQTYRAATTTSTAAPVAYTQAGVDSAKRNIRSEIAALRAEMLRNVVALRPGTVDSLNRINPLFTGVGTDINTIRSQIATAQKTISDLNATLAGNVADDRVQAAEIKTAQDAVNSVTAALEALKQYLKALP